MEHEIKNHLKDMINLVKPNKKINNTFILGIVLLFSYHFSFAQSNHANKFKIDCREYNNNYICYNNNFTFLIKKEICPYASVDFNNSLIIVNCSAPKDSTYFYSYKQVWDKWILYSIEYIEAPLDINLAGISYSAEGEDILILKRMLMDDFYQKNPILFGVTTSDCIVFNNLHLEFQQIIPNNQLFLILSQHIDKKGNPWYKIYYKKENKYFIGWISSSNTEIKPTTGI